MGVTAARGLNQLVDNVLRGRLIGIAHAEVDDVLPGRTRGLLELTNDTENVGRQAPYTLKLLIHGFEPRLRERPGMAAQGWRQ